MIQNVNKHLVLQYMSFVTYSILTGQYDGCSKPLPEYHVKISGFDEKVSTPTPPPQPVTNHAPSPRQVLVMSSMRKPKRVVIRGDNEREYPFLIKGGEDLRQDQRIEQVGVVVGVVS